MILREDGTFSGKADCNQISGTYEGAYSVTLGPSTLAACGEDSLDQQYLQLLGSVVTGGPDGGGGFAPKNGRRSAAHDIQQWRRIVLVGGLIALGSYKLSQKQVDQVEQHTGKPAEELTDEELDQAMDDLNIDAEELSDAEWDEVEKADAEEDDYTAELERIAGLHEQGVLTDEEYAAKKEQLLGL